MHKELIGWAPLAYEPSDAIEALQAEHERMQTELQNSITRRQEQIASSDFAVASLKEERDEYQQAADKMAAEHKVERDTLSNTLARIEAKVDSTIAERDTLRQQLAEAQRDAERYRFLRDNFATKSENSVDDFIALEPMTGEYFDAHIDILMSEFHAAMKGAA